LTFNQIKPNQSESNQIKPTKLPRDNGAAPAPFNFKRPESVDYKYPNVKTRLISLFLNESRLPFVPFIGKVSKTIIKTT
jgi:hypothetical protein